jgi:hypothetical protein
MEPGYLQMAHVAPDMTGGEARRRHVGLVFDALAAGSVPLDQIGQGPRGQDPLSWKIFDYMCEKSSRIRDLEFRGYAAASAQASWMVWISPGVGSRGTPGLNWAAISTRRSLTIMSR